MNVNGISNQTSTYAAYKSTEQKAATTETEGKSDGDEEGTLRQNQISRN